MSDTIPAANAVNADALYIGSVLDSMQTLAQRLRLIRAGIVHNAPVPAQLSAVVRAHLTDLAEQFEVMAGVYPDLSGLEPDRPVFAGAALAPASSP